MAGEKCNLCDITPFEITDRIIGGNEYAYAVYLEAEGALGGCLVVPRRHEDNPCGLTDPEVLALYSLKARLYQGMAQQWEGIDVDEQYRRGPDIFGQPQTSGHLSIRMVPSVLNSVRYNARRRPELTVTQPTGRALQTLQRLRGFLAINDDQRVGGYWAASESAP